MRVALGVEVGRPDPLGVGWRRTSGMIHREGVRPPGLDLAVRDVRPRHSDEFACRVVTAASGVGCEGGLCSFGVPCLFLYAATSKEVEVGRSRCLTENGYFTIPFVRRDSMSASERPRLLRISSVCSPWPGAIERGAQGVPLKSTGVAGSRVVV